MSSVNIKIIRMITEFSNIKTKLILNKELSEQESIDYEIIKNFIPIYENLRIHPNKTISDVLNKNSKIEQPETNQSIERDNNIKTDGSIVIDINVRDNIDTSIEVKQNDDAIDTNIGVEQNDRQNNDSDELTEESLENIMEKGMNELINRCDHEMHRINAGKWMIIIPKKTI